MGRWQRWKRARRSAAVVWLVEPAAPRLVASGLLPECRVVVRVLA